MNPLYRENAINFGIKWWGNKWDQKNHFTVLVLKDLKSVSFRDQERHLSRAGAAEPVRQVQQIQLHFKNFKFCIMSNTEHLFKTNAALTLVNFTYHFHFAPAHNLGFT